MSVGGESNLRRAAEQEALARAPELAGAAVDFVLGILKGDVIEAEREFHRRVLKVGAGVGQRALEEAESDFREAVRCRGHRKGQAGWCDGTIKSKGVKDVRILTLVGEVVFGQFTGVCRGCGQWLAAAEELLGVVDWMTPACAAAVTTAAVTVSYGQAQGQLKKGMGIEVDDNRIQRLVAAVGQRAQQWTEQDPKVVMRKIGKPPRKGWIYVLVDGGRIRLRGKDNWREPYQAAILWQRADGRWQKFGVSDLNMARVVGILHMWLQALHEMGHRQQVVILGDGAEWIWEWAAQFPWAIHILDYYHLKENVWKAARVLYGEATPQAHAWADAIMDRLWTGEVDAIRARLARMRRAEPKASAKRKALGKLSTYLKNHKALIAYAKHRRAKRWIGSGAIESFVKQVFCMRMKGAGMFWSEEGARYLMSARTVYLTGHLDIVLAPQALRMAA